METLIKNADKLINRQINSKTYIRSLAPNFTYKNNKGELVEAHFESPI